MHETPYIFHTMHEQIAFITENINTIFLRSKNLSMRIVFFPVVNATVVVKCFQLMHAEMKVVGGAAPYHAHDSSAFDNNDELARIHGG